MLVEESEIRGLIEFSQRSVLNSISTYILKGNNPLLDSQPIAFFGVFQTSGDNSQTVFFDVLRDGIKGDYLNKIVQLELPNKFLDWSSVEPNYDFANTLIKACTVNHFPWIEVTFGILRSKPDEDTVYLSTVMGIPPAQALETIQDFASLALAS